MSTLAAVVSIVALVVAAAVVIERAFRSPSGQTSSSTSTTVELHRVADLATTSGLDVRVVGFENLRLPPAQFPAAPPGRHLLSVDVKVHNPGADSRMFVPLLDCTLADAEHDEIGPPEFTMPNLGPNGITTHLASGASAERTVVFTVPNGATGLVFTVIGSLTATGSAYALT